MGDNHARDAEIQARFNLVKQRYGDRLTADELDEVRKGCSGHSRFSESLELGSPGQQRRALFAVRALPEGDMIHWPQT